MENRKKLAYLCLLLLASNTRDNPYQRNSSKMNKRLLKSRVTPSYHSGTDGRRT